MTPAAPLEHPMVRKMMIIPKMTGKTPEIRSEKREPGWTWFPIPSNPSNPLIAYAATSVSDGVFLRWNCKTGPIWVCQAINIFQQFFVLPNRNQEGFVLMSSVCLFTIFFVGKSRPYLKLFTSRVKAAFPREAPSYNIYFLKNKYTRVPASIWYSLGKTSWYILANFGTHFLGKNLVKLFARKFFEETPPPSTCHTLSPTGR